MSKVDNSNNVECPVGLQNCLHLSNYENLKTQVSVLTEQARTDALTGLYNYRYFTDALQKEMERVRRTLQPMGIILVDIDHFKQFNDNYGHDVGNVALVQVAHILLAQIRKLDIACRFGGEEFVIILPATSLTYVAAVAERMRKAVEASVVEHNGEKIQITISLGAAVHEADMSATSNDLLAIVDQLLYKSKHLGRNCISVAETSAADVATEVTSEERSALFSYADDERKS